MPRPTVTSIEQLKRRRHLLLDLGPEKRYERKFTRINPQEVVGVLKGQNEGQMVDILVELGKEFWVGRNPACDLVIESSWISSWHFRLYAVRTTSNLSVVCLQVVGTRGVLLNGKTITATDRIGVNGQSWRVSTIVLLPDDKLELPHLDMEFTYKHNDRQHRAEILELQSLGTGTQLTSLFRTTNTKHTTVISPWHIHNVRLGHGAFGVIYLATHRQGLLQGAVKAVSIQAEARQRDKMNAEREILQRLEHPNIIHLFDTIDREEAGIPTSYLVLQLAAGGDLFSYLEKHGALTEDEVRFAAFQLFKALDYLHDIGVAHRDIKLENILLDTLTYMPKLLLADFGMAKTREDILNTVPESRHDQSNFRQLDVSGTINYLPPERIKAALTPAKALAGLGESLRGSKDERRELIAAEWFKEECHLDTWACGVVIYTLASAEHPYEQGSFREEPTDVPETSQSIGARMATNWADYRTTYGEIRVGEIGAREKASWESMSKALIAFKNKDPTQWQPKEAWSQYSESGKDILQGLLEYMALRRLTIPMALRHAWIDENRSDLDLLYDRYVIHDSIDPPPKM